MYNKTTIEQTLKKKGLTHELVTENTQKKKAL